MSAPRECQTAAEACGWVPVRRNAGGSDSDGDALAVSNVHSMTAAQVRAAAPPGRSVEIAQPGGRRVTRVVLRDAPTLPGMPQMLAEEPAEAAYSAAALRAMMSTDYAHDDAQTRALGLAIRAATVGTVCAVVATLAWGACYIWRADVGVGWLVVAWLGAALCTAVYTLVSEAAGRRYSAAGVERLKIETAERMHADRLAARQQMHAQAVEAWQEVLSNALDKWQ